MRQPGRGMMSAEVKSILRLAKIPVLGFAAYSGTGKTTLLIRLLPILKTQGIRVGMIKHAHHLFEIDYPGKDSYELRKAGAAQMLVASAQRWALMVERAHPQDPKLEDFLGKLNQNELDLILVEGFKHQHFPKIELHRTSLRKPLLFPQDSSIIAIACDGPLPKEVPIPVLDLNCPEAIVAFILQRLASIPEDEFSSA